MAQAKGTAKKESTQTGKNESTDRPVSPAVIDNGETSTPQPSVVKAKSAGVRSWWRFWWVGAGLIGLVAIAFVGYTLTRPSPGGPVTTAGAKNGQPAVQPRVLDGVPVTAAAANTNIVAAMIENASDSRPPSGLDKASVVYEALAEGGITRFLALFPFGQDIPEIGPIRSARQYFVEWAEEYKPLYVHAGGSPQALTYLQKAQTNVIDFNQFRYAPNFIRDKTRRAPHNLYTNTTLLFLGLKKVAPTAAPSFTPWRFKDEAPLDSRPTAVNDIVIDYSSFNYKVTYRYDRVLNHYDRLQGDSPHVTRDNSKIAAKNIVVQYTKTQALGDDKKRLSIETVGEGKMIIFRDGTVTEGTWKKTAVAERTQWFDGNGQLVALNPGTTWVEIVPTDRKITY